MTVDISKSDSEKSEAEVLLNNIVEVEVGKAFHTIRKMFVVIIALMLVIGVIGFNVLLASQASRTERQNNQVMVDITHQTSSLSLVAKPTPAVDPTSDIIGRVSALMTTADGKVSIEEQAFAFKLFSKRLKSDFGLPVGTFPEKGKLEFIDREMILKAYDDEESYLVLAESEKSLMRRQENTITDLSKIINAYVPPTGEEDAPAARKALLSHILSLAKVWTEQASGINGATVTPTQQALYQSMQNRLSDRLDMTKP